MAKIQKSALVIYSNAQMFALVDDIDSYQTFLPWCRTSTVIQRQPDIVEARLEIAYGAVNKSFVTRNQNRLHQSIQMSMVDGPFKYLRGQWEFLPIGGQGCKVGLEMEFEFANKLLDITVGPVFSQIANSLVDAFTQRAKKVYG